MIELTICLWLREATDLLAVVPDIYAINLPKPNTYPALKVSRLNSKLGQTFGGLTGEETAIIQLDYWAQDPDEIKAIKKQLTTFFDTLSSTQDGVLSVHSLREQPSFEPKPEVFKQTLELTLSYKEEIL